MTEESKTDVPSGREPAPAEPRNEPDKITDADRAANPIGTARREREAERHRDDAGKFARKDGDKDKPDDGKQPKPEAKQDGDKPNGEDKGGDQPREGTVPHQALAEERRKRQALERQVAELMQRPPAPAAAPPQQPQPVEELEVWNKPNDWHDHRTDKRLAPVNERLQKLILGTSKRLAINEFGKEAVDAADQAFGDLLRQADPATQTQQIEILKASDDPVGDVVRWHKQQTTMQKFGADPEAYIKAEIEKRWNELQNGGERHDPPPATRQPPNQPLPTSFAGQPGGGPRGGGYSGPKSLSEMLPRG